MAEADLITLLMGRAVRFSIESPESSRWRALRTARSLMALAVAPSASCGVPRPPRVSAAVDQVTSETCSAAEPPLPAPCSIPSLGPLATRWAAPGLEALLWPRGSSSSFSRRSAGRSGAGPDTHSPDGGVRSQAPSCCCLLGGPPASSVPSGKRDTSRRPEQWRRTVSGGLESLSVWDDSDTDSRFRNLWDTRPRVRWPRRPPSSSPGFLWGSCHRTSLQEPSSRRPLTTPHASPPSVTTSGWLCRPPLGELWVLTSQGSRSPSSALGSSAPPGCPSGPPSPHSGCAWWGAASGAPRAARAFPCCCTPVGTGDLPGRPTTTPPKERKGSSAPEAQEFEPVLLFLPPYIPDEYSRKQLFHWSDLAAPWHLTCQGPE